MRYLLLICTEPETDQPDRDIGAETTAWVREYTANGLRLDVGARLRPATEATTVRAHGGETLLTDGPFAETREQIIGFDLIECDSLDDAIAAVATLPHVALGLGMVEIRPLWDA